MSREESTYRGFLGILTYNLEDIALIEQKLMNYFLNLKG